MNIITVEYNGVKYIIDQDDVVADIKQHLGIDSIKVLENGDNDKMSKKITALEAMKIANDYQEQNSLEIIERVSNLLESIYSEIHEASKIGRYTTTVKIAVAENVVFHIVSKKLKELGYGCSSYTNSKIISIHWNNL